MDKCGSFFALAKIKRNRFLCFFFFKENVSVACQSKTHRLRPNVHTSHPELYVILVILNTRADKVHSMHIGTQGA